LSAEHSLCPSWRFSGGTGAGATAHHALGQTRFAWRPSRPVFNVKLNKKPVVFTKEPCAFKAKPLNMKLKKKPAVFTKEPCVFKAKPPNTKLKKKPPVRVLRWRTLHHLKSLCENCRGGLLIQNDACLGSVIEKYVFPHVRISVLCPWLANISKQEQQSTTSTRLLGVHTGGKFW